MKKLIVVRHSKSSWKDSNLSDFDRPLNKRGKRDGKKMSDFLSKFIKSIDLLISSSSNRTKLTSKYYQDLLQIKNSIFTDSLYHASRREIIENFCNVDSSINSILLIGHNPGLTEFINFSTDENLFNLPTTGTVIIEYPIEKWIELEYVSGKVKLMKFPKQI